MKYKRTKQIDPIKICNYNKFLSTLDKNNIKKLEKNQNNINSQNNLEKTKSALEIEINELIEKFENEFYISNLNNDMFTGLNDKDKLYINLYDPNQYKELNIEAINNLNTNLTNHNSKKTEKIPIQIKKTIIIDEEINDISDILKLINKYNYDPDIKYNINIKALHDIKIPLEELNNMIGIKEFKNNIVDQILYFVQGLHKNKNESGEFLHTVIYGPPGTGKTEIAKIMGKIYSKIGILSKGTFTKVTRSDLIAGYLGQTALKTKDVIKESLGGVLFIDEAYSLGNPEKRDSYAKECIDTLCEALSDYKDELMVIIAGYENELSENFFSYNQGLDSRFTWRFKTDQYDYNDLYNIFLKKVKDIGWELNENSNIDFNWFKKNYSYFRFYGRDIETLLSKIKIAHGRRVFCKPENEKRKITIEDLDKGLKIYLKNNDIRKKKEEEEFNKYLTNTLYC